MKTKGKELVEISDICDEVYSCSQYQYLLGQHNSNFIEVKIYGKVSAQHHTSLCIQSFVKRKQ